MRTAVIGLVGMATSGKDTAARGLTNTGQWKRVSFAEGLKDFALAVNPIVNVFGAYRLQDLVHTRGWDEAKKFGEVRRLLQAVGTEAGRNIIGENVWTDIGAAKIVDAMDDCYGVVVTDCRFGNEFDLIREFGGVIVRITRPGVGPVNGHISETALDGFEADFTIVNDGTEEELQAKLVAIAASLEEKAAA